MDDDGSLDSQVVSAQRNIASLIDDITTVSSGAVVYKALNIDPNRNADGGIDGGNIRTVILYQTKRGLRLASNTVGTADQETALTAENSRAMLSLNPAEFGLVTPLL